MDEEQQQTQSVVEKLHGEAVISVKEKMKMLLCPFEIEAIRYNDAEDDALMEVIVRPEAFRMWFYLSFMGVSLIAIIVSSLWATDLHINDNPIYNRFGTNNLCIFFDFPPFTYFGATLFFPVLSLMILYQLTDLLRVYDTHLDGAKVKNKKFTISKQFFRYYRMSTVYEIMANVFFIQCLATNPLENLYVHTAPYGGWIFAVWLTSVKKFLFFRQTGVFDKLDKKYYYLGATYVVVTILVATMYGIVGGLNLFGAYLFETDGLRWTRTLQDINDPLIMILTIPVPPIMYLIFVTNVYSMKFIINRNIKSN